MNSKSKISVVMSVKDAQETISDSVNSILVQSYDNFELLIMNDASTDNTAEIISQITSEGFNLLDAPPARLNSLDTPIPYHPELWRFHRPTAHSIEDKIRKLIK